MTTKSTASPTDDQIEEIAERIVDSTVNLTEFLAENYGFDSSTAVVAWQSLSMSRINRCVKCKAWRRIDRFATCQDCKDKEANS